MNPIALKGGDLFADVPARVEEEETAVLAELPGARIERIVSTGQASREGFWCDQDWTRAIPSERGMGPASPQRRD